MTSKAYQIGWELAFGVASKLEEDDSIMDVEKLIQTKTFKKLPLFIQKHAVFSKIKKIKRIFPYIGLKNCLEPCEETFDGKKTYIGFSSGGVAGLWDIATMSMRGVCSCMHWNNMHSRQLIGSITDPFLGIVYITDNEKTPYGISFRKRALVRFIYSPSNKKYQLMIERPYVDTGNIDPSKYLNKDKDWRYTLEIFRKFLISKVDAKYKVIPYQERSPYGDDYIPSPTSIEVIAGHEHSMSDASIAYKVANNDEFVAQFANQN